jgi:hypothetical protein
MQEIKVQPNSVSERLEKAIMILERIVAGGSAGDSRDDCDIPAWLHDMAIEVTEEHRRAG